MLFSNSRAHPAGTLALFIAVLLASADEAWIANKSFRDILGVLLLARIICIACLEASGTSLT